MVGWHHWLSGCEFEQTPGGGEGQGSLACCSPWGHTESDTTEQLSSNKLPHKSGVKQCLSFCVWLAWQCNVFRVHPCCSKCQNFIPSQGWVILQCACIPHCVYPLMDSQWTLGLFLLFNWIVLLSHLLYQYLFESLISILFGYIFRKEIAESCSNFCFPNRFLHSHCARVSISLHPHQHVFPLYYYFYNSLPNGCEVVLICIFLIISDVEHLFMCLFAICISSLE